MFNFFSAKRALSATALVAFLAMPSLASAHGSMVKISDNASGKTYQVYYAQALVYANGTVGLGSAGYNVTVYSGTIVYQDAWNNGYNNYQAIPIDTNSFAYKNGGNGNSLGHSGSNAYCSPPAGSAGGVSGGAGQPGTNDIGTLIGPGTAPQLITQDGGSLITQDGGSLITQDGGSLITQDGGSLISNSPYHLQNANGHPTAKGSHNPSHFACDFVYVPGGSNPHYYTRLAATPHTGLYACKADAVYLHLTDGGTWRG